MAQGTSLSADAIIQSLRAQFKKVKDFRDPLRVEISMVDCLTSAYAILYIVESPDIFKIKNFLEAKS